MAQSIREIASLLQTKKLGVTEVLNQSLDRIKQHAPELNCFISINQDQARSEAVAQQQIIDKGEAGLLTGIPMAHKDLFCTAGIQTTCASKILANYIPPYDATVVKRLKSAGMIALGKTNMDEFAMGSSNENSSYGAVSNPWNLDCVPGGSSGGSAVAVSARLVPITTGTDTGGSIRQPAALTGITGIKPSYGRVSRHGMIAFASSLDQAGVLATNADDCGLVLSAMSGHDPMDSTCSPKTAINWQPEANKSIKNTVIGVIPEWIDGIKDQQLKKVTLRAIDELKSQGAQVREIKLPHASLAVSAYYVLASAECSSNLSRFDGVRFGHQTKNLDDLDSLYVNSRTEGFGAEVKRRIMIGTWALSSGYYDAYYLKAQKIRRLISEDFIQAFKSVDVIACPVSPETAFKKGEKSDPVSMYQADIFTIPASLAGLPCLSMPVGFSNKLPVGIQLIGAYFDEINLLNVAHQYQLHTNWHQQIPEQFS